MRNSGIPTQSHTRLFFQPRGEAKRKNGFNCSPSDLVGSEQVENNKTEDENGKSQELEKWAAIEIMHLRVSKSLVKRLSMFIFDFVTALHKRLCRFLCLIPSEAKIQRRISSLRHSTSLKLAQLRLAAS